MTVQVAAQRRRRHDHRSNRPQAMNVVEHASSGSTCCAGGASEAASDDDVRAVVVTGGGRAFSSGADLRGRLRAAPRTAAATSGPRCASATTRSSTGLRRMPKPVDRRGQRAGGGDRLLARASPGI